MQAPITRIKEQWAHLLRKITDWFRAQKLAVKKWFFDRKIRRIVRDKSDL